MSTLERQHFNTVIETLNKDRELSERLISLLSQETEMLRTRQFKALPEISHEKSELINGIEKNSQTRYELLQSITAEANPAEQLKHFAKRCDPQQARQLNQVNQQLAQKLQLCREKNTVNGQVIAVNLRNNQELLSILTGNDNENKLYNASGRVSSRSSGTNYQKA